MSVSDNVDRYNKIVSEIKGKIQSIGISKNTLHTFIQIVIETVEKTQLSGKEKKQLSMKIMNHLVELIPHNDDKEFILELIHNGTISNMIDLVILASRGQVNLNNLNNAVTVSSNCCYGFFSKRK